MGYGATRSLERVAAAMGELEAAPIVFQAARDIPGGGVLLALPALLAVGLLRHSAEFYALPKGFYGLSSVFVLLALMALARIGSVEQLRLAGTRFWRRSGSASTKPNGLAAWRFTSMGTCGYTTARRPSCRGTMYHGSGSTCARPWTTG